MGEIRGSRRQYPHMHLWKLIRVWTWVVLNKRILELYFGKKKEEVRYFYLRSNRTLLTIEIARLCTFRLLVRESHGHTLQLLWLLALSRRDWRNDYSVDLSLLTLPSRSVQGYSEAGKVTEQKIWFFFLSFFLILFQRILTLSFSLSTRG